MKIALASPRIAASVEEGLVNVHRLMAEASAQGATIVCFPEAYLPGLRGQDFEVPPFDAVQEEQALQTVGGWAKRYRIATILGIEHHAAAGRQVAAAVFDASGRLRGIQTKNQLDPTEEPNYVPGMTRLGTK